MITLENNELVIRFAEVHPSAAVRISFQRTLRIPDDGRDYPLPPGLGEFPLHHVEDYAERLPEIWLRRGGVFLPMYQSEALWLRFRGRGYPLALQIAAGKINAINGEPWQEAPQFDPQGYVVVGKQPWLDGYCVGKGQVRQFVAAPLGQGITVEEQCTGAGEYGGIQIKAWPLKVKAWERLQRKQPMYSSFDASDHIPSFCRREPAAMGLAMGGTMKQELYEDTFAPEHWETTTTSRCFVHLVNSTAYTGITGRLPPHRPHNAADYAKAELPWFDYYTDQPALQGSKTLRGLRTLRDFLRTPAEPVLIHPRTVVPVGDRRRDSRPVSQGDSY